MIKIKKGDEVIVIAGRDKGKQGTVSSLEPNGKCFVSGVNMVKRHTKANPQAGEQGGIVEKESLIDISNISIFNPSSKQADKVAINISEEGKRIRVYCTHPIQVEGTYITEMSEGELGQLYEGEKVPF